jgi:hypothetical protein
VAGDYPRRVTAQFIGTFALAFLGDGPIRVRSGGLLGTPS